MCKADNSHIVRCTWFHSSCKRSSERESFAELNFHTFEPMKYLVGNMSTLHWSTILILMINIIKEVFFKPQTNLFLFTVVQNKLPIICYNVGCDTSVYLAKLISKQLTTKCVFTFFIFLS